VVLSHLGAERVHTLFANHGIEAVEAQTNVLKAAKLFD